MAARIQNSESSSASSAYQSDLLLNGSNIMATVDNAVSTVEVSALRAAVATTDSIANVEHSLLASGKAAGRAAATAAIGTVRAVGFVAGSTIRMTGHVIGFTGRVIIFPFKLIGQGAGAVVGATSRLTHIHPTSVIQPKKDLAVPLITPEQAHQAALIQKDTLNFEPVKPAGAGGACDSGTGNGGYPLDWCDAPMDSVRTVSYSSDRINRECTSYAYWYFTTVEGHADFHVAGNANRWASTSNYPTHVSPAVGAIAVETAGSYGHVAIVQALPGQVYEGKVVPAGYVLVSEMNYDWRGHFRYSYSPLNKFSAYIYP